MTAELALELFDHEARPYLGQFEPNTCIEQTRILIEVLQRLGVSAEPLATKLHIVVPERKFQFFASGDPADLERAKKHDAGYTERRNDRGEAPGYHTVALVERRIVVDLTTAQASSEEFGFRIEPCMVVIPLGKPLAEGMLPYIEAECGNDEGIPFTARWIGVNDRDWEGTPAWEPSHLWPVIDLIEMAIWNEWLARRKAG